MSAQPAIKLKHDEFLLLHSFIVLESLSGYCGHEPFFHAGQKIVKESEKWAEKKSIYLTNTEQISCQRAV